jgi:hypothetical protein
MISIFHGDNATTHEAFQQWRQDHPNGFHMTEGSGNIFTVHWTQDKRENPNGRGCNHQGVSGNAYQADKNSCYTAAKKVCSDSLQDLIAWANENSAFTKPCAHCDTRKHPFSRAPSTEV